MDATILIKINQKEKLDTLLKFLKSIDYISSVEYFDELLDFKRKLDEANRLAEATDLPEMTLEDINKEIKAYRHGEQKSRH